MTITIKPSGLKKKYIENKGYRPMKFHLLDSFDIQEIKDDKIEG